MRTPRFLLLLGLALLTLLAASCATNRYEVMLQGVGEETEPVRIAGKQVYSLEKRQKANFKLVSIKDSEGKAYDPGAAAIETNDPIQLTYSWAEVHIVDEGKKFNVPMKTKKGFTLESVTDDKGRVFEAGQPIDVKRNMVLTYNWRPDVLYSIRCEYDLPEGAGAVKASTEKLRAGDGFKLPADSESAKDRQPRILQFAGITDSKGGTHLPGDVVEAASDETYTYHYQWKKASITLVGYDPDPAKAFSKRKVTFDVGSLQTLEAPATTPRRKVSKVVDADGNEFEIGARFIIPDHDIRLDFHWEDVYEITIAGVETEVERKAVGKRLYTVPEPGRDGGFKLLRVSDEEGKVYQVGQPIEKESSIDLTYTWAHVFYVPQGGLFTVPEFSKEGHKLASITDGTGASYQPGTRFAVHNDMTLTYNWAGERLVTIVGAAQEPISEWKLDGEVLVLPEAARPGWELASIKDGEGKTYHAGDNIVVDKDMTVTYDWRKMTLVRVEGLGGAARTFRLPAGKKVVLPEMAKEGYVLDKVEDSSGRLYTPGAEYAVPDEDLTVVYRWKKLRTVSIRSMEEGEVATLERKEAMTVLPKERDGFKLAGIKDAEGRSYEPGSTIESSQTVRLTYFWVETVSVADGDIFEIPQKSRPGFKLVGITDGDGVRHNGGDKIVVSGDMELSYEWAPLRRITLLGVSDAPETFEAFDGESFVVPAKTKRDLVLVGVTDALGSDLKPGDSITVSGDVILTYNWARECKIVLAGLGTAPEVFHVGAGSKVAIPARSREGFELGDVVDEFGNVYMPSQVVTVPDRDVTLVYNWLPMRTVTLTGLEHDEVVQVADGRPFYVPAKAKAGCDLIGITDGTGKTYNVGSQIAIRSDLKLNYVWRKLYSDQRWDEDDVQKVAASLARGCLNSPALTRYAIDSIYSRDTIAPYVPVVAMGVFAAGTDDESYLIAEKVEGELLASGKVYLAESGDGADFILQGRVREKVEDVNSFEEARTYTVTAQLLDARTGFAVWQGSDSQIVKRYYKSEK